MNSTTHLDMVGVSFPKSKAMPYLYKIRILKHNQPIHPPKSFAFEICQIESAIRTNSKSNFIQMNCAAHVCRAYTVAPAAPPAATLKYVYIFNRRLDDCKRANMNYSVKSTIKIKNFIILSSGYRFNFNYKKLCEFNDNGRKNWRRTEQMKNKWERSRERRRKRGRERRKLMRDCFM